MNILPLPRALLALLLTLSACLAQEAKPDELTPQGVAFRKQIDMFFSAVENHQIDLAYDHLTKGTKIGERAEDIAALKSKTVQAVQLFGDITGHEMVDVKNVGGHLQRVTFLSLGKEFPLRWRFYYYRSGEEWKLIDLRVDDRLADLFGEAPPASAAASSSPAPQ